MYFPAMATDTILLTQLHNCTLMICVGHSQSKRSTFNTEVKLNCNNAGTDGNTTAFQISTFVAYMHVHAVVNKLFLVPGEGIVDNMDFHIHGRTIILNLIFVEYSRLDICTCSAQESSIFTALGLILFRFGNTKCHPYPSGLLYWHHDNDLIAPVPSTLYVW